MEKQFISTMSYIKFILQEMATDIIKRLSNEYSAYMDVVQPVQTAIYEMKLGLSLVLSGALSEKYLEELGKFDMESVLVLSFISFYLFLISVLNRLCCSNSTKVLPHPCRILQICTKFGGSDIHPTKFLKSPSNIDIVLFKISNFIKKKRNLRKTIHYFICSMKSSTWHSR